MLSLFPDSIVPAYRKRRTYINSLLARNEIKSDYSGPYILKYDNNNPNFNIINIPKDNMIYDTN